MPGKEARKDSVVSLADKDELVALVLNDHEAALDGSWSVGGGGQSVLKEQPYYAPSDSTMPIRQHLVVCLELAEKPHLANAGAIAV
ncbi:MAG: hypothetical protein PVS2B2_10890 [Candidatus Acidiferrum sp.]